jgi:DNA polymerase III delta prime subunit
MEKEEEVTDYYYELKDGIIPAIKHWYKYNEMRIVIVEGYTGVGKSLFSLLVASKIYNTNCWAKLKPFYVYDRNEFIDIVKNKRVRSPLLVWDDAGNWLHAQDYQKKEVIDVCKYFQVARPDWACIMLTTVDAEDIVSRIRNMKERILVQVIRDSSRKEPDRRKARVFTRWKSPDKTKKGEENVVNQRFYLHQCDETLYKNYEMYRNSFVKQAKKEL